MIEQYLKRFVSYVEKIQELFTEVVEILNSSYPNLTVTLLDNTIWQKYSAQ